MNENAPYWIGMAWAVMAALTAAMMAAKGQSVIASTLWGIFWPIALFALSGD